MSIPRTAAAALTGAAFLAIAWISACVRPVTTDVEAGPGEPLPELTPDELRRFEIGKALFNRAFSPEEGLGPLFNQAQCSSCHDLPVSGGFGAETVRRISRYDQASGCDLLAGQGGDLLQLSVTRAGIQAGLRPEDVPPEATAVTDLFPPPLYGLGLVDAVPFESFAGLADPDDRDGDGISGRLGWSSSGESSQMGMKSTHPGLAAFVEGAILGEMGLTTPGLPEEALPGGLPVPPGADPVPEPEVDQAFLDAVTDYVRFLAVPAPPEPSSREDRAAIARGRQYFQSLGCEGCHIPVWTTGENESAALDRKSFLAYSDFLLHDMGPELADICAPGAAPAEWRTPRLVGLHLRSVFLHDGRAQSLASAIEYHGGEAEASREAYRSLPQDARDDLIRFLQGL